MEKYRLIAAKGSGGAIVELILGKTQFKYEVERIDWDRLSSGEYKKINPLGQVPSLILPSGEVMTESLAICTYLSNLAHLNLVPTQSHPKYASYLRWSTYLVGSVYPTFTYSDYPNRWVSDEDAAKELKTKIDEFRTRQWLAMEHACGEPHFLGKTESLIDYYLACMVYWRPGLKWFEPNAPKLLNCAKAVQNTPLFERVFEANKT